MATELHSFRCDGALWQAAQRAAARRGLTMTTVLVEAVKDAAAWDEQDHEPKRSRRKAG